MKVVISLFNMYKGGSLSIFEAVRNNLRASATTRLIVFGNKFLLARNELVVFYPIRYLNWLYRLLIENIFTAVYGYALNADRLVMMGNFPSLFWFRNQIVFFHNTLYLEVGGKSDPLKLKLEKGLFKLAVRIKRPIIYVQTSYIESLFRATIGDNFHVRVVGSPVSEKGGGRKNKMDISDDYPLTFIYPAYYYPHKNHSFLLNKNRLFKELGCEVVFTISNEDIASESSSVNHVKFVGSLERAELLALYASSNALIFPSLNESLGLPLLEAQVFGLPIIAPNLPYVKAVISDYYVYDVGDDISFGNALRDCVRDMRNGCPKLSRRLVNTDVIDFIDCLVK
jgi:glycosyltransferase involved in cell wall biosynthesis